MSATIKILSVVLASLALTATLADPSHAATPATAPVLTTTTTEWVGGGGAVALRSGPSTSSPVVRVVPVGTLLRLECQLSGSRLGFSALAANRTWDKLWGEEVFVHDRVTATSGGLHEPAAGGGYVAWNPLLPRCAAATTPAARAVAFARGQLGTRAALGTADCARFVQLAYGVTPLLAARTATVASMTRLHRTASAPAGAIVVTLAATSDEFVTGISLGDGRAVLATDCGSSHPVQRVVVSRLGAAYLGWTGAPSAWPGRQAPVAVRS